MISSKVLAFGLLFSSPFAFATVQLDTSLVAKVQVDPNEEFTDSKRYSDHTIDTIIQLDTNESQEIYNHDDVKIVAQLLAEEENTATVGFTIYTKNKSGEFQKFAEPVLVATYTEPAGLGMGATSGESIRITIKAQKA